ncbi:putative polysaccharide biosynthesis protein [Paenibacillus pini]
MKDQGSTPKILQGAFVLGIAMLLSKLIGTLQKIPLQNMGGDVVFGIYNAVYPFYTLMITLAVAGLPAAISKFVSEDAARGGRLEGIRVLRISTLVLALFGLILGTTVFMAAPWIGVWIDNSSVVPAIRASSLALLFVPVMSGLRGYFQGYQNMVPTALSQIIEQSIRVAVMIVLLVYLTNREAGAETIAAGALVGSAAGGAAGLFVMLRYWAVHRKKKVNLSSKVLDVTGLEEGDEVSRNKLPVTERKADVESSWSILKRLLLYAIPICLGMLAVPLINLVDTFTVPRLLKADGFNEEGAMIQFGIYNRGMPLVQLITMLATSLSVLFIPALAEARITGNKQLVTDRTRVSLRWFWLLSLAASVGLAVLAVPLNVMLYEDAAGSNVMRWVAFTAAGSAMSIITAAMLQGIGIVRAPAVHLLAAAAAKTLLNLLLVPQLGITGAAIAGVAAHFMAAALNGALLARHTGLCLSAGAIVGKPALLLGAMALAAGGAAYAAQAVLPALGLPSARLGAAAGSLLGAAMGGAVFIAGAAWLQLLSEAELRMLPKIGSKLIKPLQKLKLLKEDVLHV